MSFYGALNVAGGSAAQAVVNLKNTIMRFNAAGNFATTTRPGPC